MISPILLCLDFLHTLLSERGLIALYHTDQQDIAAAAIQKQFSMTDRAAESLKELPRGLEYRLSHLKAELKDLPEQRESVLAREKSALQNMIWYGAHLIDQTEALATTFTVLNPRLDALSASSLINLLRWQILLADLREMGVFFAAPAWIRDQSKIIKLRAVAKEQQAYERLFFGMADESMRQLFENAVKSCPIDPHLADVAVLRLTMQQPISALAETDLSATDWFVAFSAKIDILQNVARALVERAADLYESADTALALDPDVEAHKELIRTLPLFKGLSGGVLEHLLKSAHLARHEKNTVLLTQGEVSSKLMVILEGWVKMYKTAPSGEESILHIAGKREALFDTNVFVAQSPSPVSVRALTKTWVLTIGASALREGAARYRELAFALLSATHARFQKLIGQYEQMTLRSASERVGWFLLNLNKDYGIDGQPLTLPYDKALIAAYLNIKPETFSRALKELKKKGFKIERDQITLPHPKALCSYCDYEIAGRCCHADQEECPRPDLRLPRAV